MEEKIKILHCPADVGGQAWMVSRAERKLGYQSDNIIFKSSHFNYPFDYNLNCKKGAYFTNFLKTVPFFFKAIKKYDVFHFYFGKSILSFYLDLPILKILRKKIFFTFQGCDIRRKSYCISHFKINACQNCQVSRCQKKYWDLLKFLRLKIALFFANKTFVLNPDLRAISSSSEMLPYVNIDLDEWKPIECKREKNTLIILHAPTDRNIKGTKYVIEAISKLKEEGYPVKLKLIEGVRHTQMKELCMNADIVIDQLLIGWYGGLAVETMALQKPVVCYLNKNLLHFVPWAKDIPIVNVTADTLYDKLKWLIKNPQEREKWGREGRRFVEKYHNPMKIAQKLIKFYQET